MNIACSFLDRTAFRWTVFAFVLGACSGNGYPTDGRSNDATDSRQTDGPWTDRTEPDARWMMDASHVDGEDFDSDTSTDSMTADTGVRDARDIATDGIGLDGARYDASDVARDTSDHDAGWIRCGSTFCSPGQLCCEATGACYPEFCDGCCRFVRDAGSGTDASLCGTTICLSGQVCCERTRMCYDPRCLECCR